MRVHVVDPSAYTPPYDHALCSALGEAGADVELYTSRFVHAALPAPAGYARREFFYRAAARVRDARLRSAVKLAEHVPGMLRYARAARAADVVHFQWLAVQQLDGHLLPSARPLVLTAHDVLPREGGKGRRAAQRRLYGRFDAVVAHSRHGRERLVGELGVAPERVHVIPHGALTHLARGEVAAPLLAADGPVVLFFGLLRPYKGLEVLLEAWRGVAGAELWIVGMPRMDVAPLRRIAGASVRFDLRFVSDAELRGYLRRADLVVAPYLEAEQSGVLLTALALGKPLLVSDLAGFADVVESGAARAVPRGDPQALREALAELLSDEPQRAALAESALAASRERFAWDSIAQQTLALYRSLLGENARR